MTAARVLTIVRKHLQNSLPEPRILFSSQIVLNKIKLYLLYGSRRLFWGMGSGVDVCPVLFGERRQSGHWPTWLDLYKNKNYSYRVFVVRDGIWTLA